MSRFDRNDIWRDLRRKETLLHRYDQLSDAAKYLREYGRDMKVTVRFAASAVGGHDRACEVVAKFLQGPEGEEEARRDSLVAQIEEEMRDIEDQLA